ncbi:MAG: hypothetical protein KAJ75_04860 [Alphaproteobacteria bacterium]|nr:hypothetical protein [Alphaproteobacteria bacterium]
MKKNEKIDELNIIVSEMKLNKANFIKVAILASKATEKLSTIIAGLDDRLTNLEEHSA